MHVNIPYMHIHAWYVLLHFLGSDIPTNQPSWNAKIVLEILGDATNPKG